MKKTKEIISKIPNKPLNAYLVDDLFPPVSDSTRLLLGTGREDFVASHIARAVEDADASLLNMNVIHTNDDENRNIVHIRFNHRDPERVARSLERYGYNILRIESAVENINEQGLKELMHYLSI